MTDPIADMLTRMRNALKAGMDRVDFPASKIKAGICKVLKEEGYIKSFKILVKDKADIRIRIVFKEEGPIVGLERASRPGLRYYGGYRKMPRVISGLGISILSTSQGVISSRQAIKKKIGGEILCNVW
ncbi:MAG: 30S ribosomal protein S8 [Pseudomonadota bacterium]